jgi:hypothetical protein
MPRRKRIILIAAFAAVAVLGVLLWPSAQLELKRERMSRWSGVIGKAIRQDPAWSDVRGSACIESGNTDPERKAGIMYAKIEGVVGSDVSLEKLKTAIEATGFPYPIKWSVTVTNAEFPR